MDRRSPQRLSRPVRPWRWVVLALAAVAALSAGCPTCELTVTNSTERDMGKVGLVLLDREPGHHDGCAAPPAYALVDEPDLRAGRSITTRVEAGRHRVYVEPPLGDDGSYYFPEVLECSDGSPLEAELLPGHDEEVFAIGCP